MKFSKIETIQLQNRSLGFFSVRKNLKQKLNSVRLGEGQNWWEATKRETLIREYCTKPTQLKVQKETPLTNTDKSTRKVKTEASISHGQRCGTPKKCTQIKLWVQGVSNSL